MSNRKLTTRSIAVIVLLIIIGAILTSFFCVNTVKLSNDGRQSAIMAYNLNKHGVLSLKDMRPTMKREPFMAFSAAPFMDTSKYDPQSFYDDPRNQIFSFVKVNIVYVFIILVGSPLILYFITGSIALALLSYPLLFMYGVPGGIGNLLSELPAAAVMILYCLFVICVFRFNKPVFACIAGVLLGLLPLIKGVFLYFSFPIIILFFLSVIFLAF